MDSTKTLRGTLIHFLWDLIGNSDLRVLTADRCRKRVNHSVRLRSGYRKQSLSLDEPLCRDFMLPQFPLSLSHLTSWQLPLGWAASARLGLARVFLPVLVFLDKQTLATSSKVHWTQRQKPSDTHTRTHTHTMHLWYCWNKHITRPTRHALTLSSCFSVSSGDDYRLNFSKIFFSSI